MDFFVVFFMCVIAPVLLFLVVVFPPLLYILNTKRMPNQIYEYFE